MADSKNMRKELLLFPEHVRKAMEIAGERAVYEKFNQIFVVGMGSSALCGDLLRAFNLSVPLTVVKDYSMPASCDSNSLVFVVSYSGNPEETISCYRDAQRKKAKIISISSGGRLKEVSAAHKTEYVQIPAGIQPRLSLPFTFFIVLKILSNSKAIPDIKEDVERLLKLVKVTDFEVLGRGIAQRLNKKIPIIYTSQKLEGVAKRWKTMLNENAKVHAFYNIFPELNHNEVEAYGNIYGNFYVIMLKDNSERDEINRRYDATRAILKGKSIDMIELAINGDCLLSRMFMGILIGDWASYYLAMDIGVDPSDISTIEGLKVQLKKNGKI